ncbi:LacI family DNA-binding transcriptional regulator [Schinkia azotoformans]|uniref:LacI family DNA-binding transcriptional regulator n=1 Tax=Schinkia azotoformans TaxID=1454 RepID=UPI002DBD93E0|nr:substrate-binding domain-containing protein [Schinkia azotoformans]
MGLVNRFSRFQERRKLKKITMADVAQMANVSKSTVSQYLNHRYEYMSEDTRTRIEEAIATLGYRPNILARSLKQKKTSTIGVIVANILHMFSTQVIRAIEDVCSSEDINVIVCNADDNPEKEKKYIEMLRAKQVDGLVVFPTGDNLELYESMKKEKYPLIFVDRMVKGMNIPSVLLDNETASEMAVDHLYSRGYRRIAMLTTPLDKGITPRVERVEGYKKALKERSLIVPPGYIKGVKLTDMQNVLEEMFNQPEVPEALFSGNDLTLLEILKFVKKKGMSIPRDLALISIDEVSFSEIYEPSLTIISQPAFEMGKYAAEKLLEQIRSNAKPDPMNVRFSPSIVVRKST